MATKGDDPKKTKEDGKLVSQQDHEVDYLKKKTGLPEPTIRKAIEKVGPSRAKVMEELEKKRP
jgi:hypothetical protein